MNERPQYTQTHNGERRADDRFGISGEDRLLPGRTHAAIFSSWFSFLFVVPSWFHQINDSRPLPPHIRNGPDTHTRTHRHIQGQAQKKNIDHQTPRSRRSTRLNRAGMYVIYNERTATAAVACNARMFVCATPDSVCRDPGNEARPCFTSVFIHRLCVVV